MANGFTDGLSDSTIIKRTFDPTKDAFRTTATLQGDVDIGDVVIIDVDSGQGANVLTDTDGVHRVAVDAGVTSVDPNDVVTGSTHNDNTDVKASYTVPVSKQLFITSIWASTRSADIVAQFKAASNPYIDIPVSSGANSFATIVLPTETPLGPFGAGQVIEIERIEGLAGLNWSAGWVGYLK